MSCYSQKEWLYFEWLCVLKHCLQSLKKMKCYDKSFQMETFNPRKMKLMMKRLLQKQRKN